VPGLKISKQPSIAIMRHEAESRYHPPRLARCQLKMWNKRAATLLVELSIFTTRRVWLKMATYRVGGQPVNSAAMANTLKVQMRRRDLTCEYADASCERR
jgi:hypothetical protein